MKSLSNPNITWEEILVETTKELKGEIFLQTCSLCGKQFPTTILKDMIQIVGRKAYLHKVCPACQMIAANNPAYYYLHSAPRKVI